ncbi:MAG TPA: SelB C-terminal domain-containing protein, partial [Anaerolineales bacterium]|nr:SelB C-terminal domain-containing protein [Anaerolineales bacterium]
ELLITNSFIPLEEGTPSITSEVLVLAAPYWNDLRNKLLKVVDSYHQTYPLRRGIPREELKSRLKLPSRVFNGVMKKLSLDQSLTEYSAYLAKPEHEIRFDNRQESRVGALMQKFEQNPFSPPSIKECQSEVGEEVLNALVEIKELILLSPDVIFRKQDYEFMKSKVQELLVQREKITLAEVRDLFNTSRKYAQAFLEHLDTVGITRRDGDFRRVGKQ